MLGKSLARMLPPLIVSTAPLLTTFTRISACYATKLYLIVQIVYRFQVIIHQQQYNTRASLAKVATLYLITYVCSAITIFQIAVRAGTMQIKSPASPAIMATISKVLIICVYLALSNSLTAPRVLIPMEYRLALLAH